MDLPVEPPVNVICIPCDGPGPVVLSLPLLSYTRLGSGPEETKDMEECLMRVPDIIGYGQTPYYYHSGDQDWRRYRWQYRKLVNLGNMDPDDTSVHLGPYYMYKGSNRDRNLLRSEYFDMVPGAKSVYGDVFIFKVKEREVNDWGEAKYDKLDYSSIQNAFKGKGLASRECLRWLSEQ